MITAIMLTRNDQRWLPPSLEAMQQIDTNLMEWRVADLASDDASMDILDRHRGHMQSLARVRDLRWSEAAMLLTAEAKGDWLWFLPAGSMPEQGAIGQMKRAMAETDAPWLVGQCRLMQADKQGTLHHNKDLPPPMDNVKELLRAPMLSAFLFRKDYFIEQGGFEACGFARPPRMVAERHLLLRYIAQAVPCHRLDIPIISDIPERDQHYKARSSPRRIAESAAKMAEYYQQQPNALSEKDIASIQRWADGLSDKKRIRLPDIAKILRQSAASLGLHRL